MKTGIILESHIFVERLGIRLCVTVEEGDFGLTTSDKVYRYRMSIGKGSLIDTHLLTINRYVRDTRVRMLGDYTDILREIAETYREFERIDHAIELIDDYFGMSDGTENIDEERIF